MAYMDRYPVLQYYAQSTLMYEFSANPAVSILLIPSDSRRMAFMVDMFRMEKL